MTKQAGLCQTLFETLKTGFLEAWVISVKNMNEEFLN